MNGVLLILHLVGLMMGAGGGFGSMIVMRIALTRPPEQAGVLRSVGPSLAKLSTIGLGVMWLTGLIMVWTRYGGPANMPTFFWIKIIFVLSLTIAAIITELTYTRVKQGDMKAAGILPKIGPVAGISSLLAVIFAVLAFG